MSRAASTILLELIELGEKLPGRTLAPEMNGRVDAVLAELAEHELLIGGEAELLALALRQILIARQAGRTARANRFAMIAGVVLPMVRENFGAALEARRTPPPADGEPKRFWWERD